MYYYVLHNYRYKRLIISKYRVITILVGMRGHRETQPLLLWFFVLRWVSILKNIVNSFERYRRQVDFWRF